MEDETRKYNPWEAVFSSNFIRLQKDEPKTIVITQWNLALKMKEFDGKKEEKWELTAKVTEEDGQKVDLIFNTVSKPLLLKLRPILEPRDKSDAVKIQIIKIGDGKSTAYSVREVR